MDPSALRAPSPTSYTLTYPYTSIPSDNSRISVASSSVPSVSTIRPSSLFASSSSYSSSGILGSSLLLLYLALPIRLCLTECVAPYIPALRPAHIYRLPHTVFAWSPDVLITSLARARRSIFPIPTERTPVILSIATGRQAISAQYAAHGGEELATQSASLETTTLSSSMHTRSEEANLLALSPPPPECLRHRKSLMRPMLRHRP